MVGRFIATTDAAANAAAFRNVGMPVPVANVVAPCAATTTFAGRYGSVFSVMTAGPNRVIGFTRINFTRVATCPVGINAATAPYTATITRQPSIVASSNATAVLSGGFVAAIPPALVGELLQKNLGRTGVDYGPVLVATLAR